MRGLVRVKQDWSGSILLDLVGHIAQMAHEVDSFQLTELDCRGRGRTSGARIHGDDVRLCDADDSYGVRAIQGVGHDRRDWLARNRVNEIQNAGQSDIRAYH